MVSHTDWYVSMALVAVAAAIAEALLLMHFATKWSREVARFLEAVSFDDTSARFSGLTGDRRFRDLGAAMGAGAGAAAHTAAPSARNRPNISKP